MARNRNRFQAPEHDPNHGHDMTEEHVDPFDEPCQRETII